MEDSVAFVFVMLSPYINKIL